VIRPAGNQAIPCATASEWMAEREGQPAESAQSAEFGARFMGGRVHPAIPAHATGPAALQPLDEELPPALVAIRMVWINHFRRTACFRFRFADTHRTSDCDALDARSLRGPIASRPLISCNPRAPVGSTMTRIPTLDLAAAGGASGLASRPIASPGGSTHR